MDRVLAGIPKVQCLIDDIIITGNSDGEHLQILGLVLQRLKQHNLQVNPDKCLFLKEKRTYCTHEITAEGLNKTSNEVKVMAEAPKPKDLKHQNFAPFSGW